MSLWSDADEPNECEACGRLLDGADLCPSCDYPIEEDEESWTTYRHEIRRDDLNDLWDTTDDEAKP